MNDHTILREHGDNVTPDRDELSARYRAVRDYTVRLSEPLNPEDQQIQSMADASPTKWHLAHVTWFFETFLLAQHLRRYEPFHPQFGYLFNSYYEAVGPRHARPERGFLSRPTCEQILDYRRHVDGGMDRMFASCPAADWSAVAALIELGLHHEQQHQELLLMDIKHVFSCNPLAPAYVDSGHPARRNAVPADWVEREGGLFEIGHDGAGFAFDNEGPRHRVFMEDFQIASRPVTNREYLEFIRDGGYEQASHWHSDGWATVNDDNWSHPLYWREDDGEYREFTLAGLRPLDLDAPVCHVSFYEASAYASWAGARLPTEAEWEVTTHILPAAGETDANLLEAGHLHPVAADAANDEPVQMIGDVWEWTRSAYGPYPGYAPADGAVGEYNGKFMANQMVLRGGACVTPPGHVRTTYRNFFYPHQRWAFSGFRLAAAA